jgi:hypothetical protein
MTIPAQPEPSDATRFATRPKQRRKELVNATNHEMTLDRKKTVAKTMAAIAEDGGFAHLEMVAGMWRQYGIEDDRTLDPETVAEAFARAEREYSAAIHNRAVIREYGVVA